MNFYLMIGKIFQNLNFPSPLLGQIHDREQNILKKLNLASSEMYISTYWSNFSKYEILPPSLGTSIWLEG